MALRFSTALNVRVCGRYNQSEGHGNPNVVLVNKALIKPILTIY